MKNKLKNLIHALLIASQMPNSNIKARQLRSFFGDVDKLDFTGTGYDQLVSSNDGTSYSFILLNQSAGIDIHIEAVIGEVTQTVDVKKETILED